jgi:TonB-linked SusC/RagA family outer membrane protein
MNIRNRSKLFLIMLLSLSSLQELKAESTSKVHISLQTLDLNGRIVNEFGKPIAFATIKNQKTNQTVESNANGEFTIKAENGDSILFSSIGYLSQTIAYDGKQLQFVLIESTDSLDEVVVVGYGTQKKVNLSGAVDYVDAKAIASRPIANVSQGLQGLVPNLNIQFNSGAPGEAANFNIRGITSINGGSPLILIDNVPVSSAELNRISPQDIESFSIIKDASAAAIYGARASFGVIIITTKSGKGSLKVNYNNNFTWNTPTVMPNKIVDPYIFSRLLELSTDNTPWDNVNYSDQYYAYAKERSDNPSVAGVRINPSNPKEWEYMGNRDWSRYFLSDWNSTHNHDLSLSGSSEKVNYYFSGGYNRQNSPIKLADDFFDRYTIRSKVKYTVTDFLKFGNNTIISNTNRKNPSQYNLFDIYNSFPTSFDKNPDGTWANSEVGRIAARMIDGGEGTVKRNDVQSTFNVDLDILKNIFKISADYTYQRNSMNYNWFTKQYNIGFGPNDIRTEGQSSAYREAAFSYYNVYNIFGSYNQTYADKHQVSALLGFNQEDYRIESFIAEKQGLISDQFPTIKLATGLATVDEAINSYALRGAFMRFNYTYDDKYIVEFNGRYDGSSRFPKNKRFGFFPSASAAWRLDREHFMSQVQWMSMFKIRGSYGELGNQSVSNYGYIPAMSTYELGYLIDGKKPLSIYSPALVSDNYTWEKVNTSNIGLDLAFLNNEITLTADAYSRRTIGMLTLGRDLPNILGASEPNENAADLNTKGWELAVGYNKRFSLADSPLGFSAKFILSNSVSEITKFDNPNNSILQYYKGMELGEIWGLESNGLFTNTAEIDQLDQTSIIPWGALSIVPGWPKYVDQDGNGIIEKGYTLADTKDLKIIGNTSPRYQFALDLSFDCKGFDVRTFFQGIGKRDYYPLDYLYWGAYQQPYGNMYGHLLNFYRPENDSDIDRAKHSQSYLDLGLADQNLNAEYPILQSWLADRNLGTRIDQSQGLAIPQTNYLLNAAYLRFKNLTIGYTVSPTLLNKYSIKGLRIYFSAENITEWSAVKNYFDPETINQNQYTNPTSSPGRAGNGLTYPFQRSFSGGLQLTF